MTILSHTKKTIFCTQNYFLSTKIFHSYKQSGLVRYYLALNSGSFLVTVYTITDDKKGRGDVAKTLRCLAWSLASVLSRSIQGGGSIQYNLVQFLKIQFLQFLFFKRFTAFQEHS